VNKYFPDIVKNISQIVTFQSVQTEAKAGMPFGEGAAKCLEFYLSLAKSFGFDTKNYDNYVGEVTWGEGKDFAVLAHLDVVPAGNGWEHDPFGGEIDEKNQKIWGRGTMDDKGPAIITLFALKALKDEGLSPKRTIKVILGCNEETGWACIDHYNKVAVMPEEGISPDANFPVIYAEKGILHVKLCFDKGEANFTGIKGGSLSNMVCDYCEAYAPYDEIKAGKYNITKDGDKVIARGKSAHGSTPDKGVNAIKAMLSYLGLEDLKNLLFEEKLGLKDFKDTTGPLTLSPNLISEDGGKIYVTCDIRYPATYKRDDVLKKIEEKGVSYEIIHDQAPLFNDINSPLITTLLNVYNNVCGTNEKPIAIGGGTYARALKCGAAFGPEEEGEPETIHQANEYITFAKIDKCFKIYTQALKALCC
jgi:succinyl-diaminopimelate desuccinylase